MHHFRGAFVPCADKKSWSGILLPRNELAILEEGFAINDDLAILPQITDHVPVNRRFIDAAGFRIAMTYSQVESSADLFIEKHLFGEALDAIIGADTEFTQVAGTLIRLKHCLQEIIIFIGGGMYHFPLFKGQVNVFYDMPKVNGRIGKGNVSLDRIFHRSGVDLATGHIDLAVITFKCTPFNGELQINIFTADDYFFCLVFYITCLSSFVSW